MSFYVYLYLDPEKIVDPFVVGSSTFVNEPLYVGKGKDDRCYAHLRDTRNSLLEEKINHWTENGIDPIIVKAVEDLSEDEAHSLEIELIARFGRHDLKLGPLFNKTNGGEGFSGLIPWNKGKTGVQDAWNKGKAGSEIPWFGKEKSDSHKQKIRESLTGKSKSEEHKKKISESLKGNVPWNKGKTGVQTSWAKGKKFTEEHKKNMSIARKGKKNTKEQKEKISKALKGRTMSEETRRKMSESRKKYWKARNARSK